MDEGSSSANNNDNNTMIPDLKDIEVKIGRKTPEGLLRCMREEASKLPPPVVHDVTKERDTGKRSLDDKIRKLKLEMAHLRSVDVKILHQLLTVHEGIEAVKWLMEERSTLTSRCSSLTSSQYSLGEGPDTSWRGSWSSLHDNDKLDNISIGSYLDTLADDMDEYCPSSSESVICSSAPPAAPEAAGAGRTGGGTGDAVPGAGVGAGSGSGSKSGTEGTRPVGAGPGAGEGARPGGGTGVTVGSGMEVKAGPGTGTASSISAVATRAAAPGKSAAAGSSPQKSEGSKQDAPIWTKATEREKGAPVSKDNGLSKAVKTNGVLEKATKQIGGGADTTRPRLNDKLGKKQSPKLKPYKNGKIDLESCKRNGKMHLEYDAHWRWVQSQEDVTFL